MPLKDAVRALHSMAKSYQSKKKGLAGNLALPTIEEQWQRKVLLHHLEVQVDAMVPHQVNMVVYSLATLSLHPGPSFMSKIRLRSLSRATKFNPRETSTTIWGVAVIESTRPDLESTRGDLIGWTDALLQASINSLQDFTARDICQVLGSLCTLQHPPTDARDAWTAASVERFKSIVANNRQSNVAPRDISGTLFALSSLTSLSDKWWINQALIRLQRSSQPGLLSPRDAAETMMAVSRLGHKPSPQMVHFLATTASSPLQLSCTELQLESPGLARLHNASQSLRLLANTAWALSRLGFNAHPTLMSQIMSSSSLALDSMDSILQNDVDDDLVDLSEDVLGEILRATGHSLSLLVWSFGKLGWLWPSSSLSLSSTIVTCGPYFLSSVAKTSSSLTNGPGAIMSPQSIALLLFVFAKSGYHPSPLTLTSLLDALLISLPQEITPQAAAMTLLSIGRLRFRPCDDWMDAFVRSVILPILKSDEWRGSQEWRGILRGLKQIGFPGARLRIFLD